MEIIKFVVGTVVTLICLTLAVKLLFFVLALASVVFKLIWLAVIVGILGLICYAVYKVVWPNHTEQI